MNRRRAAFAFLIALAIVPSGAVAWEAETTHPGFTEKAALESSLHSVLVERFGLADGLLAVLRIDPKEAPELFVVLRRLNPSHGYAPSKDGSMTALSWLLAGSAIADTPLQNAANHFFDPSTGEGLDGDFAGGLLDDARVALLERTSKAAFLKEGKSAMEWVASSQNPLGLPAFRKQYSSAVSATNLKDRQRHLASALLTLGAVAHVLQDLGSPSHVQNDIAAHFERLGAGDKDRGSRYERVAALAYGRLGIVGHIQQTIPTINRKTVRDYFSSEDGQGLADITAKSWFSAKTLPRDIAVRSKFSSINERLRNASQRQYPGRASWFDEDASMVTDDEGRCLANAAKIGSKYSFYISNTCYLEQLRWQVPMVIGYSTGLLETLFGPGLNLKMENGGLAIRGAGAEFGDGTVTVFWDDKAGNRKAIFRANTSIENTRLLYRALTQVPSAAVRVSALYEGKDHAGGTLSAAGTLDLEEKFETVDLGEIPVANPEAEPSGSAPATDQDPDEKLPADPKAKKVSP